MCVLFWWWRTSLRRGENPQESKKHSYYNVWRDIYLQFTIIMWCLLLVMKAENLQESMKHSYYNVWRDIYLQFTIIMLYFVLGIQKQQQQIYRESPQQTHDSGLNLMFVCSSFGLLYIYVFVNFSYDIHISIYHQRTEPLWDIAGQIPSISFDFSPSFQRLP